MGFFSWMFGRKKPKDVPRDEYGITIPQPMPGRDYVSDGAIYAYHSKVGEERRRLEREKQENDAKRQTTKHPALGMSYGSVSLNSKKADESNTLRSRRDYEDSGEDIVQTIGIGLSHLLDNGPSRDSSPSHNGHSSDHSPLHSPSPSYDSGGYDSGSSSSSDGGGGGGGSD